MKTNRIAYICADPGVPVFGRKGCSIHVQEILRSFVRRGLDVSLFAARFDAKPPPDLSNISLHSLPAPSSASTESREEFCLAANEATKKMLDATQPFDLIYERYSLWSYAGMRYARENQIPGLLEVNSPLIEEQIVHRSLIHRGDAEKIAEQVFSDASALVAVSQEVAQYLERRGIDAEHIQVIPNAVDPCRFSGETIPTWVWLEKSPFVVGFVGTLKPWHGVSVLVEAFAGLHGRYPDSRLLVVGDGPERNRLLRQVEDLKLERATHFTGAVRAEQIPGLLALMDVGVAPYPHLDNFYFSPLKVYEYMAAGCATVASRIGQLGTLIAHEQNGLLVEPGNSQELAELLMRLRDDIPLRQKLSSAGRETILREHTWDQVAERLLKLVSLPTRPPTLAHSY